MKINPKVMTISTGLIGMLILMIWPEAWGFIFYSFICFVGGSFLVAGIAGSGRFTSRRVRFGAVVAGIGVVPLGAAHLAEACGARWATPELCSRTFLFLFLPCAVIAGFLWPRRPREQPRTHAAKQPPEA
jgi:hypothetical protein